MSTRPLAYQQSVFKCYYATSIFRVLPTRQLRKPAGIDTERNYVTVTLCIVLSVGRQPYPPFLGKRHCLMCISAASRPIA